MVESNGRENRPLGRPGSGVRISLSPPETFVKIDNPDCSGLFCFRGSFLFENVYLIHMMYVYMVENGMNKRFYEKNTNYFGIVCNGYAWC